MTGPDGFLIGVISDTHGVLRPEAIERLSGARHILHAGDIGAPDIVWALRKIAPVTAIRGNIDRAAWATEYPKTATVVLAAIRIHLVHDRAELSPKVQHGGVEVVVFGHSHKPVIEQNGGVLFLNPGSAGPRRFRLPVTVATIAIAGGEIRPTIHQLID